MGALGRLWAGRIYGTNTGNLFFELNTSGGEVSGTARLMDTLFGLTVYRVTGSFDEILCLHGEPTQSEPSVKTGSIDVTAVLTPDGHLRGEWRSSIGTAGTFEAYPHDVPAPNQRAESGMTQVPEQIYTSTINLGALRLYAKDVWELAKFIQKDFVVGRMLVTYTVRGNEVTKYLEDFQREAAALGELRRIKLTIQELEAHGINKVVVVDLNSLGRNEIRVQGINESWVVGNGEAIARMLRVSEKGIVTTYKKFGLTLNQIIFLVMLVLIPAIASLWQRAVFVLFVGLLLVILFRLHSRFIPSAALFFGEKEPTVFQRAWPSLVSWLITVTATLAATLLFFWLTRRTP